jgi:hypothetical protein
MTATEVSTALETMTDVVESVSTVLEVSTEVMEHTAIATEVYQMNQLLPKACG